MLGDRLYWIFDMDGTLTLPMHDFDAMRAELGLPPGGPILEAIAAMDEAAAADVRARLDRIELRLARAARPQPGAHELLAGLASRGARMGILTRNNERNVRLTLETCGLAEYFGDEAIVTRDACAPKPSPDGILLLLSRWGGSPERSVMVGDFLFDLVAGRAAGAVTVHFDSLGRAGWDEHTDLRVSTLFELHELAGR